MAGILEKLKARLRGSRSHESDKVRPVAPAGRLPARQEQRRVRRVYVGLDFGTCSVKAVVQVDPEDPRRQHFLAIAHSGASKRAPVGFDPLLCPSTVDVRGGQLFFGYLAEAGASPAAIRSFKMCLPCLWDKGRTSSACPRCASEFRGHYIRHGRHWSAEDVATLFLAHVIRGIKESVLRHVPGEPVEFFINSAAPLDQMPHDTELGRSFQRVLYFAERISDRISNPIAVEDALRALADVRRQEMPELSEVRTTVFPETHAAMTSVMAALPEGKNFGTIDIGAGTTDVAIFYYHRAAGQPEACYYTARSKFKGMDDLDAAGKDCAPSGIVLRTWRQGLSAKELDELSDRFREPVEEMWRHFRLLFGESYMRNPGLEYWNDITVFLTGGGAQVGQVLRRFERPFNFIVGDTTVSVKVPQVPSSLQLLEPDGRVSGLSQLPTRALLLLAYGLSQGAAKIADWVKDYSFYREHQIGEGGLVAEVPYSDV